MDNFAAYPHIVTDDEFQVSTILCYGSTILNVNAKSQQQDASYLNDWVSVEIDKHTADSGIVNEAPVSTIHQTNYIVCSSASADDYD